MVKVLDAHTIEAVFYERGAGKIRSSGTASMAPPAPPSYEEASRHP